MYKNNSKEMHKTNTESMSLRTESKNKGYYPSCDNNMNVIGRKNIAIIYHKFTYYFNFFSVIWGKK